MTGCGGRRVGDLGPWNTVYRDGVPVAFIDWDGAEPVEPVADLAAAAWAFVPLAPPAQLTQAGELRWIHGISADLARAL